MKYKWLHLSDLHSYCNRISTKIMRDALLNEIKELHEENPFSFIVITGDISDKNQGYENAIDFIEDIMTVTDLSSEAVFLVPGNHDLDRNIPDNRGKVIDDLWNTDILDDKEDESIEKLIKAQADFFNSYKTLLNRSYPIENLHFKMKFNNNLNIIHLNTSWMCYDSLSEKEKLHIGLNKVYSCLEQVEEKSINIVIGHHSISELKKSVGANLKSIFKSKNVDLYLSGHTHESLVVYDTSIDTEFCTCRQVRAEDNNYPAGFIVGNINTEEEQSYFLFHSWSNEHAKWTYDYTVEPAKHGKYYLRGKKFSFKRSINEDIIIDLKLKGPALDYNSIKEKFNLKGAEEYRLGHKDIKPKNIDEWNIYLKELTCFYNSIIKGTDNKMHIFPIAPIPLLVYMGYLLQNNNPNLIIYQYNENDQIWVIDEKDDNISIKENYKEEDNDILAVSLSISAHVNIEDINDVIKDNFDLLNIQVDNPHPGYLNYKADVLRVKSIFKERLDQINYKYNEIHLFLAAPAGLCIEVGRIIRENMYPDIYVYDYVRRNNPSYSRIYNLMEISDLYL
ncbi:MAG: SAVED domain-containing protein [bacterium]